MRPALLCLLFCSTVLRATEGSRLRRLEADVKLLKTFIFGELTSIRDEVKEISNRVDILENNTVTHDPSSPNQEKNITFYNLGDKTGESGKTLVRAGNNEASLAVITVVQNMRKAYANDKKDLHQLKQDVKGQLRELEQKITSHMHNLTADVQHNIEYIHENISLANVTLSEFINGSISNVNIFSNNIKKEMKALSANTNEQLALMINQTETNLNQNITKTYHEKEDKIETFISIADRNVSEMMLKADTIFSMLRIYFSETLTKISTLSLALQTVNQNIQHHEEKLTHDFKQSSMLTCNEDFIANNGRIKDGYYYPCAKDIRLANVYPYRSTGVQGRLEVRHDRKWGTVCDDSFQSNVGEPYITNNVNMVCRMFGFRECQYMLNAVQGRGSGDIWMNYVRCDGQSSFLDCPHEGWGNGGCTHYEDIGFRMWN
ncbi:uncharacterized protein LOC128222009 isoform X2 [Mya arenaria]|uniref:uncharacterized protein LOC128222009 isoform X2 n=1 Tax=Mya arenaria TaxID=6604 RepID=UPI0022E82528|nr:uncharacterized protein LOC128222009 isoform X2 [Mya arenaria]